ncbi:hypothetical protein BOTBODRAFT_54529 [Botryobasidium botryosum FD-172 SS1]|uniref:Uncharacterized protein n=1 Tax=Botryobasidium botryosum (strain FD-172 SS1) TaxID=930990 RepID=A0A067MLM7_BOTB1|nr:hypothetical protein BOTBODRAFT_54529 [Botryobasidium botryosum FD-172 SS1]
MPSHRERSRSPRRERERHRDHGESDRDRDRDRDRDGDRKKELPLASLGVDEIDEKDYFQKNAEFRRWLKDEKGKYFDEITGEKARSYFRKFVKAWNRGQLSRELYAGIDPSTRASTQTGYKWSFASNKSRVNQAELEAALESVASATNGSSSHSRELGPAPGPSRGERRGVVGPTLPSGQDMQIFREDVAEAAARDRAAARKRDREEVKERVEELVGPREGGREGRLENKRVKREADRSFREKSPGGEVREDVLMGGGDSFKAAIARRDAARKRFEEKRQSGRDGGASAPGERISAMKEKEKQTMEMLAKLAKERFG